MTESPIEIPAHVRRFLEVNFDTVPQLETLLMMYANADRSWMTADVAARNYTTEQREVETLNAPHRRDLVTAEQSPPRFRFNPANDDVRALVAGLAASNAFVVADLFLVPEVDLYRWRLGIAAMAMLLLVYGFVFESDRS